MILLIGLLYTSSALSQSFSTYYRSADGQKKEALKTALFKIISNHSQKSYSSLWDWYEQTDASMDNPNVVFDMFSKEIHYFSSVGSSMNKEHVVPQSWWGKGNKAPIYSDLLNVYPSETKANSAKSNYPLGKVTGTVSYDNGRIKVGTSKEYSGGSDKVFEPCDEFKGDFARIYLYDATCYQDVEWYSIANAFPTGVNTYPTLESWIIPLLLEWNKLDPPSAWEKERNNRVYKVQGNRNPFIDYPQLADYIWGDSIDYAWDLDTAVPSLGKENGEPDTPNPNPNPGGNNEDDKPEIVPVVPGNDNCIWAYNFTGVRDGNSNESSGSSSPASIDECDSLSSVRTCYKAGHALRLGTSKNTGSITTKQIPVEYETGKTIFVTLDIKGWTYVEGMLKVSIEGGDTKHIEYSETIDDDFKAYTISFDKYSNFPTITIETTEKRCFINSINIYVSDSTTGVNMITNTKSNIMFNLAGQRVDDTYKGIVIVNGKVKLNK